LAGPRVHPAQSIRSSSAIPAGGSRTVTEVDGSTGDVNLGHGCNRPSPGHGRRCARRDETL